MQDYAPFLIAEDERLDELFGVENEAKHAGRELVDDPYPAFARLRRAAPVHKGTAAGLVAGGPEASSTTMIPGVDTYTVFSFELCNKVLQENEVYSSEGYWKMGSPHFLGDTILNKVGSDHRSFRDGMQAVFKPTYVKEWWNPKFISSAAEILVNHIKDRGEANLFTEICTRMPFYVTSAAFGVPPELVVPFRMAMETATSASDQETRQAASDESIAVLEEIINARRKDPRDDIITALTSVERKLPDGSTQPFTNREIIDHVRLIVYAGGGTTYRQMGITLFALLDNPDQLAEARDDEAALAAAVLEGTRWNATDPVFPRMTTEDVVLGGVEIPAESMIEVCLGAANRDESRWVDPDVFDLHRPTQRNLAFMAGPHSCLGQHVARSEMEAAVGLILNSLPGLRWDETAPHPTITGGMIMRGPSALPVVWEV